MLEPVAGFFDLAVNLRDQIGEEIDAYRFGVFDSQFEFVNLRFRDLFKALLNSKTLSQL